VSKNKSVLNWTFCQLLSEKPNCTKMAKRNSKNSERLVKFWFDEGLIEKADGTFKQLLK
jgi:hypothetical protein